MDYTMEVGQVETISPEMGIGMIILWLVFYLFFAYCLATLAKKQGKPFGSSLIMAIIPIANIILMMQLAGKPWWWLFLLLIPIVNFVIIILVWMGISERMGRPNWWGVLIAIVPIVNIVLFLMLVFGKKPEVSAPTAPTV